MQGTRNVYLQLQLDLMERWVWRWNRMQYVFHMCTYGANLEVTQHQITGDIERVF